MTEQAPQTARHAEVDSKLALVRALLERRGLDAVVLGAADHVAWATAGITNPIERGATASPLWLVVRHDRVTAVTTNVERERVDAESWLDELGISLDEVPWYEPGALERAAAELADASPARIGGLGADVDDDLVELRLALHPAERERIASLAGDATSALEDALRTWVPGELDLVVQSRISERLDRVGAFGACLIVGGDDRVERFRHPLAAGVPMTRLVMAVVVAERGGLHVAATRFASAGPLTDDMRAAREAAVAVEHATLDACVPGARYGEVLAALDLGYAEAGHPGVWTEHYQGGPVGYRQREFEIVPTQTGSRWYSVCVEDGHAVAWNPSVAGGGKAEDTYLVESDGLRRLTDSGTWPLRDGRPAVLDTSTGEAA